MPKGMIRRHPECDGVGAGNRESEGAARGARALARNRGLARNETELGALKRPTGNPGRAGAEAARQPLMLHGNAVAPPPRPPPPTPSSCSSR